MHPLRKFRTKSKLTQTELADRLNVTRSTVARWEAGVRRISPANVFLICRLTDIDPAELRPDLAQFMGENAA